jgi:hypothetical protein
MSRNVSIARPAFADTEYHVLGAFLKALKTMKSEMMDEAMEWSPGDTDEVVCRAQTECNCCVDYSTRDHAGAATCFERATRWHAILLGYLH